VANRDPHQALKTEVVSKVNRDYLEVALVRLQWSKDDVGYSLHVNPTSFSSAGFQRTDLLSYLGFKTSNCAFTGGQKCYVNWVDGNFDVEAFLGAFPSAYKLVEQAERGLSACGFRLPQPEGWSHFFGRSPRDREFRGPVQLSGDSHTAMKTERMKQSEDEAFEYHFTWIETGNEKGWVTHYRPKHPPLSAEMISIFTLLALKQFEECPEFDFEPCYYKSLAFQARPGGFHDSNADYAHRSFDAHAGNFTPAIKSLLDANAEIERGGLNFLLTTKPAERVKADIQKRIIRPKVAAPTSKVESKESPRSEWPSNFDVALSFSGTDRKYAKIIAEQLRNAGFSVFYDNFYPEHLWGKNLTAFLDEVYRKKARFCVVLISQAYKDREWTNHELRSAQARALQEKGNDYILPIRIDETDLDGLPPNLGYVSIELGTDEISRLLVLKLQNAP
jgi:hypothetical protein